MRMEILVVDDDQDVRESLRRSLNFEGYEVRCAADGAQALTAVAQRSPDAVIPDLQMPVLDGLATCRQLRANGWHGSVLMLTAAAATSDRVTGLDAGADDYLPKPFALEELLARLRAMNRRVLAASPAPLGPVRLAYADLVMNVHTREAFRGSQQLTLTPTEWLLLELLLRRPRVVFSRAEILRDVWGYDFDPGSNTLDVFVGYLRRKTESNGEPRLLQTVRGVGYCLRSQP
jgi:two-component system, OmpR family, response regulator MprA